MKQTASKYLLPLFAYMLSLCACGDPAYIKGDITGLPDSPVYISEYTDGALAVIDSTRSEGGRFSFRVPDMLPGLLVVTIGGYPEFYLAVISDGSDIAVSGSINYHDDIIVTGNEANDLLREYRESVHTRSVAYTAIERTIEAMAPPEEADSLLYGQLIFKRDSISQLLVDSRREFVRSHPQSIVSAMFAAGAMTDSTTTVQADSLLRELDPAMPDNDFLRRLRARATR